VSQQWHIHIGAHKTATTHLQDILCNMREELLSHSINFTCRETIREQGIIPQPKRLFRIMDSFGISTKTLESTHWLNNTINSNFDILLISEENILGKSSDLLNEILYKNAEYGLNKLSFLREKYPVTLYLSIRSFDKILPSAYAQKCRMGNSKIGEFDIIKKKLLNSPPSWHLLVNRILKIFRPNELVIWTFEDYIKNPSYYLSYISNNRIQKFVDNPIPNSTKTPSAEAIYKLEEINGKLSRKTRRVLAEQICRDDDGRNIYRPFTDVESKFLIDVYEEDKYKINKLDSCILI
jgi:hypothetical protein